MAAHDKFVCGVGRIRVSAEGKHKRRSRDLGRSRTRWNRGSCKGRDGIAVRNNSSGAIGSSLQLNHRSGSGAARAAGANGDWPATNRESYAASHEFIVRVGGVGISANRKDSSRGRRRRSGRKSVSGACVGYDDPRSTVGSGLKLDNSSRGGASTGFKGDWPATNRESSATGHELIGRIGGVCLVAKDYRSR